MSAGEGHVVLELFAGTGVGVAIRNLGAAEHAVELNKDAIATRRANGMDIAYEDVWDVHKAIELEHDTEWGSPPCFPAGAPVVARRGVVPIEEVRVGDEVLTHRGRWRRVTNVMSRETDAVKFGNIVCTPDHPFYAARQWRRWNSDRRSYEWGVGGPEWTPASDLQAKFIAHPVLAERDAEVEPPMNWWLVGRWLADGWGLPERQEVCIAVGAGKEEQFEARAAEWRGAKMPTASRYTLYGGPIEWLREHFGHGAHGKTIPGWLLSQPESVRAEVLDGYLSGDGHREKSGWSATSVSLMLITGIRLLAESLGYTTNLVLNRRPKSTTIEGRMVNQSDYWTLRIVENDHRYSRTIGGHRWVKQRKKVEPAGFQTVYDITVDEDESFVCWGYVVHNCPTFSAAGKGSGRKQMPLILDAIERGVHGSIENLRAWGDTLEDPRSALTLVNLHYAWRFSPTYIALEQVPAVLPIWEAYARVLSGWGYSVWTGKLHAEQYGVPQTRQRAILMARRDGKQAKAPTPTHSRYHNRAPEKLDEGVKKWVSMAEAIGHLAANRPSPTVTGGGLNQGLGALRERGPEGNPAFTVVSNYGSGGDPSKRGRRMSTEPSATIASKFDRMRVEAV